jgi:hypothetical protein
MCPNICYPAKALRVGFGSMKTYKQKYLYAKILGG